MKFSAPHILEGVVTGLIVAALGYCALQLWKRYSASGQGGAHYAGQPVPQDGYLV